MRTIAAAVLAVVLIGAAAEWLTTSRRSDAPHDRSTDASRAMPAMSGHDMAGMAMTNDGSVTLTEMQIRQFGVTFDTAKVRMLTSDTRTTGVVTVDETKVTQVSPRFGGFVERLYVNATGQRVRRGQPLLDVYSPELVAAQQELLVAGQLQRDIGRSAVPGVPSTTTDLVAAARRRLQLWNISDAQIDEVLRTGRVRRTLTLYAPASGVVLEKRVVQGQAIQPGEQLYTVADLSDVWIDVQLREGDAAAVRQGSGADIVVTGLTGRPFKGRVTYVYPTLDSASRAVRARVVVTNTDGLLKPGMYATVTLTTPGRSALTVPTSAVLRTGERNVVFVDMGHGSLMPHEVELGATAGSYTEVLAGLEAGQRVVTSSQFLLDSESNIGEVMKAMLGQMSTPSSTGR
jgi:Cu(I)/Ag(I) efflux system membrane fusion protein